MSGTIPPVASIFGAQHRGVERKQAVWDHCRQLLDGHHPSSFLTLPLVRQHEILERHLVDPTRPVTYISPQTDWAAQWALNPVTIQGHHLLWASNMRLTKPDDAFYDDSDLRVAALANYVYYSQNTFLVNGHDLDEFLWYYQQAEPAPLRRLEVEMWAGETLTAVLLRGTRNESPRIVDGIEGLARLDGFDRITFRLLVPRGHHTTSENPEEIEFRRMTSVMQEQFQPTIRRVMKRFPDRVVVEVVGFQSKVRRMAAEDVTAQWRPEKVVAARPRTPLSRDSVSWSSSPPDYHIEPRPPSKRKATSMLSGPEEAQKRRRVLPGSSATEKTS